MIRKPGASVQMEKDPIYQVTNYGGPPGGPLGAVGPVGVTGPPYPSHGSSIPRLTIQQPSTPTSIMEFETKMMELIESRIEQRLDEKMEAVGAHITHLENIIKTILGEDFFDNPEV